jgi:hypothetical protein
MDDDDPTADRKPSKRVYLVRKAFDGPAGSVGNREYLHAEVLRRPATLVARPVACHFEGMLSRTDPETSGGGVRRTVKRNRA